MNTKFADVTEENALNSPGVIVENGKVSNPQILKGEKFDGNDKEYQLDFKQLFTPVQDVKEYIAEKHIDIVKVCYTATYDGAKELAEELNK